MIARSYIRKNLDFCTKRYNKARGKKEAMLLAKMSILELCGWIELSFDDIILSCAKRNLRDAGNLKFIKKDVVERTFGFEYEKHFTGMLIRLIGMIEFERLEKKVNPSKLAKFKAALGRLKVERDKEAHTYIKGTTRTLTAPSVIQSLLNDVDEGLSEFEVLVRSIKR